MKYLPFFCSLLVSSFAFAQVTFSSLSFNEALQKAKSEGKLIFLQFESADCKQCNDVANKGFENKEVGDKMNQAFFCLKIDKQHPDRTQIAQTYDIAVDKGFGTFFLDYSGNIIHKFLKTTSWPQHYLNEADIALLKAGEGLRLHELEEEYRKGNRDPDFIEVLLKERKVLNFQTDSLLDEYVSMLPPDSLKSMHTVRFVMEMIPLFDSKAGTISRKDSMLFEKAWNSMNLKKRIEINNGLIQKNMKKAIQEKNERYAIRTASYARSTHSGNYAAGAKAYYMNMLRFYDETNDTAKYLGHAVTYYNGFYHTLNADSIKRMDSLNVRSMLTSPEAEKAIVTNESGTKTVTQVTYQPIVQDYARELNNIAYEVYSKTDNPTLISAATVWAEKALEFYKAPEVLDTYARLLYKQNQTAKAIEIMSEAIAIQKKRGYPTIDYDIVLGKMKNKSPL
jgi:hypothetical protein